MLFFRELFVVWCVAHIGISKIFFIPLYIARKRPFAKEKSGFFMIKEQDNLCVERVCLLCLCVCGRAEAYDFVCVFISKESM